MKPNRVLTLCAMTAALTLSVGSIMAQTNGGGQWGGGGFGGWGGGGGFGGGNFDPAQMQKQIQQFMMQHYQRQLGITNDTEWGAVQPLVQEVLAAQRTARGGMGGMIGGGVFGGPRGLGAFGGKADPAAEALQKAVDDNANNAKIKQLLTEYKDSQKAKQAALAAAQRDLRKVLSVKQEALATLMGLLN
jgi:hypothetical protein